MKAQKFYSEIINDTDNVIYDDNDITIIREENRKLFFHIKKDNYYTETYDVTEAVAIMMTNTKWDSNNFIWNIKLNTYDKQIQSTIETLLWLSGGYNTWNTLDLDWLDYYSILEYEYGYQILELLKQSNTLNDLKNNFRKNLNLDTIYNFIIHKDIYS